jgi:hypothetical protein
LSTFYRKKGNKDRLFDFHNQKRIPANRPGNDMANILPDPPAGE